MPTAATPIDQFALSVIIPAYNAETFILATMHELIAYLAAWPGRCQLIVVNDGSTDRTSQQLAQATVGAPIEVQVIDNVRNRGKGAAVCRGMRSARGARRVFLDADLPYPPTEIARVCAALADGADVAVACRVHRGSRFLVSPSSFRYQYTRHVAGRLFNWLVRLILLPHIRDSQAGLKGFAGGAADQLFTHDLPSGFSFDLALLRRAQQLGLRIDEVPVFYCYVGHASTLHFVTDGLAMLWDLVQIRMRSTNHQVPPHDAPEKDASAPRGEPPHCHS